MKKILTILFLYAFVCIIGSVHAGLQFPAASFSAADPYCGDDLCTSLETCKTCIWDCGVCNETDEEGSGGGYIGTAPERKKIVLYDELSGKYFEYPIDAKSYLRSNSSQNYTIIRLMMLNGYDSPTPPLRVHLEATMSWFKPKSLSYSLGPDGYTENGWPYWDIPPLEANESTEISFNVNSSVGFAYLIDVKAESLYRWEKKCKRLVPDDSATSEKNISDFLSAMNQSQDITIYHEETGIVENATLALVYLDGLGIFGVFRLNSSNVSIVEDSSAIASLVSNYATENSQQTNQSQLNLSKPYGILSYAKVAKAGPEKSCMIITGMDKFKCVDRQSCFYSCFSVPVCSMIANGWPFIDTLLDYNKSIDTTNIALDESIDSADAFRKAPSYETASSALADMKELNKKETEVVYHPLFTTYNFCQPSDYAMPQQMYARRVLLDYLDENCLHGEEPEIVNQSVRFANLASEWSAPVNVSSVPDNITTNISAQVLENVTNSPNMTSTNNAVSTNNTPGEGDAGISCCVFGICSIAGFETLGGVCWEWWVLVFTAIIICIGFMIFRKRKM